MESFFGLGASTLPILGCSAPARTRTTDAGEPPDTSEDAAPAACTTGSVPPILDNPMPNFAFSAYVGGRGEFVATNLCAYQRDEIAILMITVSAAWCIPCDQYAPYLVQNAPPFIARGLVIVDLLAQDAAYGPATQKAADAWIERHRIPFDVGIVRSEELFRVRRESFPTTYFIDPATMVLLARPLGGFDEQNAPPLAIADQLLKARSR